MENPGRSGQRLSEQYQKYRAKTLNRGGLDLIDEPEAGHKSFALSTQEPMAAVVAWPSDQPLLESLHPDVPRRKRTTQRSMRLEKLVRADRFTLLVQQGTFPRSELPAWRATLEHARPHLERAIRAVGRIEDADTGEHVGTGWLAAPGLVVTNRHVGAEFAIRQPDGRGAFRSLPGNGRHRRARIDFKEESGVDAVAEFLVEEVPLLMPDDGVSPDLAVLKIRSQGTAGERMPDPIPLFDGPIELDQLVAAIGYPAEDPSEKDRKLMRELFPGGYSVKRLSPGKVMQVDQGIVQHDCSTLGGSSGSPLIDLTTGGVLGIHFSGVSRVGNWAVGVDALQKILSPLAQEAFPLHRVAPDLRSLADMEEARKGATHPPDHYDGRKGYDPAFLGTSNPLPLPMPINGRQGELALRLDVPAGHDLEARSELRYRNFSTRQNAQRRLPWVTAVNIDGRKLFNVARAGTWARDGRINPEEQAGNEIYTGSGFSRGHMVRRLDACWGDGRPVAEEGNSDTFTFTNACPQEQVAFNDRLWGDLEDMILARTDDEDILVSVFTGPIFTEDDPYVGDLQTPMSFFKIVAFRDQGTLKVVGFVLSQQDFVDITEGFHGTDEYGIYEEPIEQIAQKAGLCFPKAFLEADVHGGTQESVERRWVRSPEDLDRHFSREAAAV